MTIETSAPDAVVLVNLGTPSAPTAAGLRRYLAQFLGDPRVVEIPRIAWLPILHGIILRTRPARSAAKYRKVWLPEGSPLKVYTERQAQGLAAALVRNGQSSVKVAWAMRYGEPALPRVLDEVAAAGARRIRILPLYPQYAASTTASTYDAVCDWLRRRRAAPAIELAGSFPTHPGYITALAASVREHWHRSGPLGSDARLVMSFHGLPQRSVALGDPYQAECLATGHALAVALGLSAERYAITFQSRFGPAQWLQPYTQNTLESLPAQGIGRVDVICPGFPADCLETLEEIALECREAFLHRGGKDFHYIPALNERGDWIAALTDLALGPLPAAH